MKFEITLTEIHNGTMYVEAETEEQALEYAEANMDKASFQFGECTVDYATLLSDKDASQIGEFEKA